jgi:sn-glycerol 3-phosphate transport system permease protein
MAEVSGGTTTRLRTVGRYAVLVALTVVVLLPIYVTVIGSLKPGQTFLDFPRSLLPVDLTLSVLREAWTVGNLDRYLLNSVIVATLITVGQVVTSILAAYAFAFLWMPAKRLLFVVFLATLMVPAEAVILSNVLTIQTWGWIDSYQALVVPFLATTFGTFLIRQVFMTIPRDLREAAALDGLGHWRFMWDVAVPIARPAIGALALFSFLSAWNQYLWPQRVTNSDRYRTVQIGLKQLQTANVDQLNLVMAGTVLAALPIFVLLVVFQRQLVRGLTAGAVKG